MSNPTLRTRVIKIIFWICMSVTPAILSWWFFKPGEVVDPEILELTRIIRNERMAANRLKRNYKAIVIGATGATGKHLVEELLKTKEFAQITVLGRREVELNVRGINIKNEEESGRLTQFVIDMENITMETCGEYFKEKDVFFSCLGTTRRAAGSAAAFRHVDFDYVYDFAKVARDAGVNLFSLMSSQGANANSYFLYLRTKGEIENACSKLEFPHFSVFRPGFLDRGNDERWIEKLTSFITSRIPVQTVARAMVTDSLLHLKEPSRQPRTKILYNADIQHLSDTMELNLD